MKTPENHTFSCWYFRNQKLFDKYLESKDLEKLIEGMKLPDWQNVTLKVFERDAVRKYSIFGNMLLCDIMLKGENTHYGLILSSPEYKTDLSFSATKLEQYSHIGCKRLDYSLDYDRGVVLIEENRVQAQGRQIEETHYIVGATDKGMMSLEDYVIRGCLESGHHEKIRECNEARKRHFYAEVAEHFGFGK
jgi:hypothetical protein